MVQPVNLAVRNGDAAAKARRAKALTFGQPVDHINSRQAIFTLSRLPQMLEQRLGRCDVRRHGNCAGSEERTNLGHKEAHREFGTRL